MKDYKEEHKFKIGDVLKHKSQENYEATKLLVLGTGYILYDDHIEFVYDVHYTKRYDDNSLLSGLIINEKEVELFKNPMK